ncbi:CAP domain-containing protein [Leptospira sp. GIMC2001]|uniref:CAP domain-containing protein n=1 Tax=Leptospira sp. GIMC2001 TaxID=1513297 RepID=UPI00234B6592|nr:CAP domain-containing protein [Leptospira sp. GIMC2001]WCL50851.1 CAP domain-containing protein [Leptospira sp. GIMC2001]
MKKLIILLVPSLLLSLNCIQNLAECPMDTITLKTECEAAKKEEEQNLLLILGIAAASASAGSSVSGNSLEGKALEFYNILESYRSNGSYTLTNGTTRTFLNSSRCSGGTAQNPALNRAAQKHNDNMVRLNFFSHTGQDGSTPSSRVRAEGLNVGAGENIAAGNASAENTFNQWWNSSGHRSNIENCNYTHVGIGYTDKSTINTNAQYSHYWTNVFATIR